MTEETKNIEANTKYKMFQRRRKLGMAMGLGKNKKKKQMF